MRQAVASRRARPSAARLHHGFHGYVARVFRFGEPGVFVHHAREQLLVERSPVHADAHRLVVLDGHFDHGAEVVVVLAADGDVAGIDAVLGQRPGALGILLEQDMAVVMEVADDGHVDAESGPGRRRCAGTALRGSVIVHGDAHQFGPGAGQRRTCWMVPAMSAVSVLVMDCTTTGASLPTRTLPMFAVTDFLRCMSAIVSILTEVSSISDLSACRRYTALDHCRATGLLLMQPLL